VKKKHLPLQYSGKPENGADLACFCLQINPKGKITAANLCRKIAMFPLFLQTQN